jgi:H+/Cl- antiporter ClcA
VLEEFCQGSVAADYEVGGTDDVSRIFRLRKTAVADYDNALTHFIFRLLMMLFITENGATGGIFIPTLAIGALTSAIIAKFLIILGMPSELSSLMIFLGMCAFIGGTLRAPITASVLFVELSGQFTGLFYVAVVVFVVSLITGIFNLTPFYDKALEEMTEAHHHGKEMKISRFTLVISPDDFVVGKSIRDIMWPHASIIESISHADSDILLEMDDG